MGIIFFILTVLVVPIMSAGATVPRWAFLSIVCAALLFKIEIPIGAWLLMGYVGLMAWVAPVGYEAAFLYWHFLLYAVLFIYAWQLDSLRSVAIGVGSAMALNSALVLYETFFHHIMPSTLPDAGGLFYNHNLSSEVAAMAAALAIGYRLWWLLPGLVPTLAFGSRAPVLALGAAGCVALWRWDRFWALMTFLSGALVMAVLWSYRNNGLGTLGERIGVWQDMIPHLNLWGHGLGSFIVEFPLWQQHSPPLSMRFENPHSDPLQIAYELGLPGLLLMGALAWRMARVKRGPEWYCLFVFLVEGCVGFSLYEPVTGGLAALCAGRLFVDRGPVRELLGALGFGICDWAQDHGNRAFRGVSPVVSAHSDPTLGGGLRGHLAGGSIEDRYRRAGHPL